MKYTLIAAMFAACTLALSACGEKKQAETPPPAPAHEATTETAPAPAAAPAHETAATPETAPEAPKAE